MTCHHLVTMTSYLEMSPLRQENLLDLLFRIFRLPTLGLGLLKKFISAMVPDAWVDYALIP